MEMKTSAPSAASAGVAAGRKYGEDRRRDGFTSYLPRSVLSRSVLITRSSSDRPRARSVEETVLEHHVELSCENVFTVLNTD